MSVMAVQSDLISEIVGNFGKWQIRIMLIIFLCKLPTAWFTAVVIFTAPQPNPGDFYCRPPDVLPNDLESEWIKIAHPIHINKYDETVTDYCSVYLDVIGSPLDYIGLNKTKTISNNMTVVLCDHFSFNSNYHSLVVDYKLVCRRQLLLPLAQCFHIFGLLAGGIIAFLLMKIISPKRVMFIGMITQILFGISTGMVHYYEFHLLFRCLSAAACALMYTSGQTIFLDITNGHAKKIVAVLFELFWSIGLIMLPVFKLFIVNWWNLYIAISTPTIILVFLYRFLPDSPRWLLRCGRIESTMKILIEGGTKNKRSIPYNLEKLLKQEIESGRADPPQADWCSIWDRNPRRRYLFAVHYAWSVYVLLFSSMILNIRAYGRDHLSINTIAIGFSEITGVMIGMYLILYTRRRWLWSGCLSISSGILAYFTWLIPSNLDQSHIVALEMMPSMAIKMATSTGLCVLMTCTADLVTPDKKRILMLSCVVWSRVWFLWSPFIFVLRMYDAVLPLTVFATLIVIAGILMNIVNSSQLKIYKKVNQGQSIDNKKVCITTITNDVEKLKGDFERHFDIPREI